MIKFRAWDKVNKCMDDDFFIHSIGKAYDYPDRTHDTPNIEIEKTDNFIIMQSTGLKDKNGVEIFCGDIVDDNFVGVGVVKYEAPSAAYKIVYKRGNLAKWFIDMLNKEMRLIEVIGNIHSSPELMEQS